MGGFKNQSLNTIFRENLYIIIIKALIAGCALLTEDCCRDGRKLPNHEERIRNCLLEDYLDNDSVQPKLALGDIPIRFTAEVPEHYSKNAGTYMGRSDIRVTSINWFANRNDYYIIECKRVDGTQVLNQKYVDEGICRFIGSRPKYPSYNHRNIMLGFVVRNIDRSAIIDEIAKIHKVRLNDMTTQNVAMCRETQEYSFCESKYTNSLTLGHIFYDISEIISI